MGTVSDEAASEGGQVRPFVIGANQHCSSLALRDRLYVEPAALTDMLDRLRRAGLPQVLLLATCDRVEIVGADADPEAAAAAAIAVLSRYAGIDAAELSGQFLSLNDTDAIRHLFRVAASLDSTVIGEPHILAQLKAALAAARTAATTGPDLEAMMQAALAIGKRVRNETSIGERAVTVTAATVELARSVHGALTERTALVIGGGEMGDLIASALREAGLRRLSFSHPRPERAEAQARLHECHMVAFNSLATALVEADILVGCLGVRQHAVGFEMMRAALKTRRQRPVLLIDAAVPGDFDPTIDRLDAAFLYTFDDLENVAARGRASRQNEAATACTLVEDAVAAFQRERAERLAVPLLALIRGYFESVRADALADAGADAEKATRLLINRLLHGPTQALRSLAGQSEQTNEDREQLATLLKRLFQMNDDGDGNNDGAR